MRQVAREKLNSPAPTRTTGGSEPVVVNARFRIVVIGIVAVRLFIEVKLDRIKPNDHKHRLALVASHMIALLDIEIYVNFFVTFRTDRRRHFLVSPEIY
jgi:hypothetical protein